MKTFIIIGQVVMDKSMTSPIQSEERKVKKTVRQIIAEYVFRNDVGGLAEYFRAYIEDSIGEKEELSIELSKAIWEEHNIDMSKVSNVFAAIIQSEITADNVPEIVNSTIRHCQETIKKLTT